MKHDLSPDQEGFDFEQVIGEIPPYRLQLLRDAGALASTLAEKGTITESTADDVVICMRTYLFGSRFIPEDDGPRAA